LLQFYTLLESKFDLWLLEGPGCAVNDFHSSEVVAALLDLVHDPLEFFIDDLEDAFIANGTSTIVGFK